MVDREKMSSRSDSKFRKRLKIQLRDRRVVWFAGVHGIVTMLHIKQFAFESFADDGFWESVSDQAVYRRLKKLCDAGLLAHTRTWHGDHGIYRATRSGLAMADLDLDPVRLDKRDYEHDLRVVDLALALTDYTCEGWTPERLIRSRIKPGMSIGRVPDGLMVGSGVERWAIELEVSGKESQRYYEACDKYADRHRVRIPEDSDGWELEDHLDDYFDSKGEIDGVVWYFFSDRKRRRALAAAKKVFQERAEEHYLTDHLHFGFQDANHPEPPPFDKWEKQLEAERRAASERQAEEEERLRRIAKEREEAKYREAENYLTERERERVRDSVMQKLGGAPPAWLYEPTLREATMEAASAKREREENRRRRKDTVKDWVLGRRI